SLPRAGKRLAPRLLAEIGDDRTRYADAAALQALAGTAPVLFQSGTYAKAHRRYACLKPLRNAMQHFAWQSTLQEPWALAYYQRPHTESRPRAGRPEQVRAAPPSVGPARACRGLDRCGRIGRPAREARRCTRVACVDAHCS